MRNFPKLWFPMLWRIVVQKVKVSNFTLILTQFVGFFSSLDHQWKFHIDCSVFVFEFVLGTLLQNVSFFDRLFRDSIMSYFKLALKAEKSTTTIY